jgi:hypothetical protein
MKIKIENEKIFVSSDEGEVWQNVLEPNTLKKFKPKDILLAISEFQDTEFKAYKENKEFEDNMFKKNIIIKDVAKKLSEIIKQQNEGKDDMPTSIRLGYILVKNTQKEADIKAKLREDNHISKARNKEGTELNSSLEKEQEKEKKSKDILQKRIDEKVANNENMQKRKIARLEAKGKELTEVQKSLSGTIEEQMKGLRINDIEINESILKEAIKFAYIKYSSEIYAETEIIKTLRATIVKKLQSMAQNNNIQAILKEINDKTKKKVTPAVADLGGRARKIGGEGKKKPPNQSPTLLSRQGASVSTLPSYSNKAEETKLNKPQPMKTATLEIDERGAVRAAKDKDAGHIPEDKYKTCMKNKELRPFDKHEKDINFVSNETEGVGKKEPDIGKIVISVTSTTSNEDATKIANAIVKTNQLKEPTFTVAAQTPEAAIALVNKCNESAPPIVLSKVIVNGRTYTAGREIDELLKNNVSDDSKPKGTMH